MARKVEAALVYPFYWPAGSFPTNLLFYFITKRGITMKI